LLLLLAAVCLVRNVDPVLVRAARRLGLGRWRVYRHVILPSALPDVLVGLRLGLSVSFFVIGVLGITSNYLLIGLERHLFRWRSTAT
jgi:ABC-type nitrate/sulfonate/bicarbonate transport system permease component